MKFVFTFFAGAAVGAAVGLLYAPKKGKKLQKELNVTSILVSHDMRSVSRIATKVALLHDHHIVFFGATEEMFASEDPYIREFLGG